MQPPEPQMTENAVESQSPSSKLARGFLDQAFCAIEVRERRGSAPRTAHSTAFSVIPILPGAG
ncbi:MAG: hypothetical protein ACLSVD_16420 [Eggerthellaceae bacterium]